MITFGYSVSHDIAPFLTEGLTVGGFLSALNMMVENGCQSYESLNVAQASWVEDVAAHAVKYAWKKGAPRPGVAAIQVKKDGRCRIHFQFLPEEVEGYLRTTYEESR
jgi:hypothetical protein